MGSGSITAKKQDPDPLQLALHRISSWITIVISGVRPEAGYPVIEKAGYPAKYEVTADLYKPRQNNFLFLENTNAHLKLFITQNKRGMHEKCKDIFLTVCQDEDNSRISGIWLLDQPDFRSAGYPAIILFHASLITTEKQDPFQIYTELQHRFMRGLEKGILATM